MTSRRLFPVSVFAATFAALSYVAVLVSRQTIDVVRAEHLLPRWDQAAHLLNGWTDYYYLKTLQIPRLLEDLWFQGYWPPGQSIYQMPFYLVLGGNITSGLRSSLAAFVLMGCAGAALLYLQWRRASLLPVALFLMFVVTSPFYLAYASVTMTEMPAALAHMCVLLCYVRYDQTRRSAAARLFAISLTALFFIKYNYFLLLAIPLLIHEYLRHTASWDVAHRVRALWQQTRAFLATPTGASVAVYLAVVLAITLSGGFEFLLFGKRIAVHTVGNSGFVVLILLLCRLWYLHRRGRIDWQRVFAMDPRVRPLLLWFGFPVIVWLASPHPNHIKDFFNLVVNRPMGEPSAGKGLAAYLDALHSQYFDNTWLMTLCVAGFVVAALRYRKQTSAMQLLILAAPLEFAMVAVHQTRFVRFLLVTLLPLWLVASNEAGYWVSRSRGRMLAAGLVAPAVLAFGLISAREIVRTEAFRSVAFNNFVRSDALRDAFASMRRDIGADEQIAIQGQSEALSPSLFKWELGPPSGRTHFPIEIGSDDVDQLDEATRVVLIAPTDPELTSPEIASGYPAQATRLQARVGRGDFIFERGLPVNDLYVTLRLYRRNRTP